MNLVRNQHSKTSPKYSWIMLTKSNLNVMDIHVVFDRYNQLIIKDHECERTATGVKFLSHNIYF